MAVLHHADALIAQMAELVDAPASGAGGRKVVEVRVLFWAPNVCFRLSETVQKHSQKPAKAGFLLDFCLFTSEDGWLHPNLSLVSGMIPTVSQVWIPTHGTDRPANSEPETD